MYLTDNPVEDEDSEDPTDSLGKQRRGAEDVTTYTPPLCSNTGGSCHFCLVTLDNQVCDCPARKWVALNVRRLRAEKEMSQEELSARANIHRTHLARFETQGINISLSVFFKIARGLQVDPRELLRMPNSDSDLSLVDK